MDRVLQAGNAEHDLHLKSEESETESQTDSDDHVQLAIQAINIGTHAVKIDSKIIDLTPQVVDFTPYVVHIAPKFTFNNRQI